MFSRFFRFSERLGRLLVKLNIWVGARAAALSQNAMAGLASRRAEPDWPDEDEALPADNQVQSLSGITVILMALVAILFFWATSPQARNNPVVRLFTDPGVSGGEQAANPALPGGAPAAASNPNFLVGGGGSIVFSMVVGDQEEIFALEAGDSDPVRLTDDPADDRDPVWSPDGGRIAFASNRAGNWDLYILDVISGDVRRLTDDLAYEAAPTWSPDGVFLAYEAYYENNLNIYIVRADGTDQTRLTNHPAPDFAPAWINDAAGRTIAYISLRDGNQDIFLLSLDNPNEELTVNLTNSPTLNENNPTWGPGGGLLAYTAEENGVSLVYAISTAEPGTGPRVVGQGRMPTWSPDGNNLVFLTDRQAGSLLLSGRFGAWETSVQSFALPSFASYPDWSAAVLPENLQGTLAFASTAPFDSAYNEGIIPPDREGDPFLMVSLAGVIAENALLSDRVDASFVALRNKVGQAAGWDFLGRLDSVYWPLRQRADPGQDFQNWHKAGRAFDIVQTYNEGEPAQIELIPYRIGPDIYWELYIRAAVQDGTLGEPLKAVPWDFSARTSGDVQAYEAGGRFKNTIPSGYYVNFTRLARNFGWFPVPSDASWRYNWPGVMYWQYEKRDGMDWWSAMLELYTEQELQDTFIIPTTEPTQVFIVTPPGEGFVTPTPSSGAPLATETPTPTTTPTQGSISQ